MKLHPAFAGLADIVVDAMGMPATLTIAENDPVEIKAKLSRPHGDVFARDGFSQQRSEISGRARWADVKTADKGDLLEQGGVVYKFANPPMHNSYGMADFDLNEVGA